MACTYRVFDYLYLRKLDFSEGKLLEHLLLISFIVLKNIPLTQYRHLKRFM